jgi:thiamine-monophosphate kinase
MTSLSEIGEFGLIKRFSKQFLENLPGGFTGIGDDCAIIPLYGNEVLLITTDMLIEDSHFLKNKIPAFDLGLKSLMVNLSDIAAMGGTPESAFLSIGLPAGSDIDWIDNFFKGIKAVCDEYGVYLMGGDTTRSPDRVVINIVVAGKAIQSEVRRRSAAKPGDIICVNDFVGDSGGGLRVLLEDLPQDSDSAWLVKRHNCPRANVKEGKWLAVRKDVHAMIDLSDGIESDIRRLMESSNTGAEIELDRVPVSGELSRVSSKYGWNAHEIAVTGGEDYCLMFTVAEKSADKILHGYEKEFKRPFYKIGKIKESGTGLTLLYKGKQTTLEKHGWDHFSSLAI